MKIAVIDSGIDSTYYSENDFLKEYIGYNYNGYTISENSKVGDDFGHGTQCVDCIHQLLPDAKIHVVRVLDANGNTSVEMLSKALNDLVDSDVDIINLSLSLTNSFDGNLRSICKTLYDNGKIITASVENGKKSSVPAIFEEVIGVIGGFHTSADEYYYLKDKSIELICDCVPMMVRSKEGRFEFFSGNSKATCVATVLVARAIESLKKDDYNCRINRESVLEFLKKNGKPRDKISLMGREIPVIRDNRNFVDINNPIVCFIEEQFLELLGCSHDDLYRERLIDLGFFTAEDIYRVFKLVKEEFGYQICVHNFTYLDFEWFWCFIEYVNKYITKDGKREVQI